MLTTHLALVDQSKQLKTREVSAIAAALKTQLARDFHPCWNIPATIDAFPTLKSVPVGHWTIVIRDDIERKGAAGVHTDRSGQPYALVQFGKETGKTCSHECLEMLVDPFGHRLVTSQSIKPGQGKVSYLVEVCDPVESPKYGYRINDILVSDFYTRHFFDPVAAPSVRYSHTGAIDGPRQVLRDGYLSWMVPETGEWWRATYFGAKVSCESLSVLERKPGQSWRELLETVEDGETREKVRARPKPASRRRPAPPHRWARNLEEDIEALLSAR